jgi:hypothetical protein
MMRGYKLPVNRESADDRSIKHVNFCLKMMTRSFLIPSTNEYVYQKHRMCNISLKMSNVNG